ncbi:hypothetical protein [Foetidibacter luteolus]|uniref:hypothetical protein n=1 Tax=Foetidibacter luteolus TaxID=2608880 RepID=UPI00129BF540|nr:hypothetical protein [Foetidibacter luteolus]
MNRVIIYLCCTMLLLNIACRKNEHRLLTCLVHPQDETSEIPVTVTYYVALSGTGHITSISYAAANGQQAVTNAGNNWSVKITIPPNQPISITVEGDVEGGKITAGYGYVENGNTVQMFDTCS